MRHDASFPVRFWQYFHMYRRISLTLPQALQSAWVVAAA